MHLTAFVRTIDHVCCRYRLQAFRSLLAHAGHELHIRNWPANLSGWLRLPSTLRGTDAVIIQRKLLAPWQLHLLRRSRALLIFDFDDAVFLRDSYSAKGPHCPRRQRRFAATMRSVDAVTAGNSFLAEHALETTTKAHVRVIPTCIDVARYTPQETKNTPLTLVWIGSASTLQGLEIIRPALEELGARLPGLRLKIIANDYPTLANVEVIRCPWSQDTETRELASSEIGISWLPDDLWSRGKCGLKVLQYMAAGLPVVTNAVGVHPEMVRPGDTGLLVHDAAQFCDAILKLAPDAKERHRLGRAGRRLVEERYSVQAGAAAWIELLQQLQRRGTTIRAGGAR